MRKLGVFVDLSNLYFCVGKRYKGRKIDYRAYINYLKDIGTVELAYAYGTQRRANEAELFYKTLKEIGFYVKNKQVKEYLDADKGRSRSKADWDVGMAIDILSMSDRFNTLVLGSADGDLEPVVNWCVNKGICVIVMATGISGDLKDRANESIEIPESLLEARSLKRRRILDFDPDGNEAIEEALLEHEEHETPKTNVEPVSDIQPGNGP